MHVGFVDGYHEGPGEAKERSLSCRQEKKKRAVELGDATGEEVDPNAPDWQLVGSPVLMQAFSIFNWVQIKILEWPLVYCDKKKRKKTTKRMADERKEERKERMGSFLSTRHSMQDREGGRDELRELHLR